VLFGILKDVIDNIMYRIHQLKLKIMKSLSNFKITTRGTDQKLSLFLTTYRGYFFHQKSSTYKKIYL